MTKNFDDALAEQIKIARKFSPIGTKLPPDFHEWFKIDDTTLGGIKMKGVFVTRDAGIPRGMILGEYRGVVSYSPKNVHKEFKDNSYVLRTVIGDRAMYIDGKVKSKSSWSRYINTNKATGGNNATFFEYKGKVFVKATRRIDNGEQVFIKYKL